jgi:hypothetical protein
MSFEEEFDKIIRRKAEEAEYPFDQNSWEKVSGLLDAERKVSGMLRFKRFYLPAALTLLIGSAGFVAYNFISTDSASNNIALQQTIETELLAPTNSSEKNTGGLNEEIEKLEQEQQINTIKTIDTEDVVKDKVTPKATIKTNLITKLNTNNSETQVVVEPKKGLELPGVETNKTAAVKNNPNDQQTAVIVPSINEETASDSKDMNSPIESKSQNKVEGEISKKDASALPANNDELVNQKTSDKPGEYFATDVQEPQLAAQPELAGQEDVSIVKAERMNSVHSFIPITFEETNLKPTEFIYLNRYDDDYYKNTNTPKKHYLAIEAGANYLLGWDANKGKDGQGLNWYAGFNYGRYLSKKINVSIGVQAYNIANIKQPFYLISEKEYGFGSSLVYTRVTTSQLYYVAIPFVVNYAINSSNTVGLGVNAAYLLNAKSNVGKYYLLDNEEKTLSEGSSNGMAIYKGTSMTNLMLSAHYNTQLSKRVGLNLEFNYGLTDIFENETANNTKETPVGIRLGLNYTLFDK